MNKNSKLLTVFLFLFVALSCEKKPTEYRKYLGGYEITYPGKALNLQAQPGNSRILLTWRRGSDPKVKSYIIYWNDKKDSILVDATSQHGPDQIQVYINNLLESELYSFEIYSLNDKGDRSVPVVMEDVKVFGEQYQNGLLNRSLTGVNYLGNNNLALYWGKTDETNTNTIISYTDISSQIRTINIKSNEEEVIIPNWKYLSEISYQSSFVPVTESIDTFLVRSIDSVKFAESILEVAKPWTALKLSFDAGSYNSSTTIDWLWDGIPDAYPRIFHSARGSTMPFVISFDLGRVYTKLVQFEEWGRLDPDDRPFSNPINFEVWGIEDITDAVPNLPADDPNWEDASISKGWTLLTEVFRTDDGINAWKVDLIDDPPPVRYIRIRIKETIDHNTQGMSHMSELSFWHSGIDYSF